MFNQGKFILHSGETTNWIIDCNDLTMSDWATLAQLAADVLPPFGGVEGVPRGGIKFAMSLNRYASAGPVLIADDVFTTGTSMEEQRAKRDALGVVVFSRSSHWPTWIHPLFVHYRGNSGS